MKPQILLLTGFILLDSLFLHAQDNYQITYSAWGDKVIEWLIPANDGNLILAGNIGSFATSGDGLILKTDQEGNMIWSKTLGGPGGDVILKIISCSDGGYVAIGYTNSFGQGEQDEWITRIDEDGEILWSDCFGTPYKDEPRNIIQTKDGNFLVVGSDYEWDAASIIALSPNGELLWKKEYSQGFVLFFNDVDEKDDGGYYLTGALNHDGFGVADCFIAEMSSTGDIIRSKVYGEQDNDSFRALIPYQDGFLALGDSWSWQNSCLGLIAKLDSDLVFENAIVIGKADVNQKLESACVISNLIYVPIKLTDVSAYIIELNADLTLNNSWQFNPGDAAYSSQLITLEENNLLFSGSCTDPQSQRKDIYLTKFDPSDANYTCNSISHSTYIENVNLQSGMLTLEEVDKGSVFQHVSIESIDIYLQANKLCIPLPVADFEYSEQACANSPVSIFNESLHGETYHWFFEGAIPATSDSIDPGTIIYENPGIYSIKLIVINEGGTDSISKDITIFPDIVFSLGPDTTLLLTSTLQFITVGNYDSYLWSTGDTTSYLFLAGTELELGDNLIWLEINNGPCVASDSIHIHVVDNTYIDENFLSNLVLYPNPATESVKITGNQDEIPSSAEFYNLVGMKVMRTFPTNNTLDIKALEPGIYTVSIKYSDCIIKRRLVKL